MQILALCCVQGGPQRLVFMRQCGRYKAVLFIMQVFQIGGGRGDSSACLAIAIENPIVFLNKSLRKRILGFYFLCGFSSLFWGACLYFFIISHTANGWRLNRALSYIFQRCGCNHGETFKPTAISP
jgi:hypothetical protein